MASPRVRRISKDAHRRRIHDRVRTKVAGTTERPRLCVYRSVGHIYTQVIDDSTGKVVYKGQPKYSGPVDKWKHWQFWNIDFTPYTAAGMFRLRYRG